MNYVKPKGLIWLLGQDYAEFLNSTWCYGIQPTGILLSQYELYNLGIPCVVLVKLRSSTLTFLNLLFTFPVKCFGLLIFEGWDRKRYCSFKKKNYFSFLKPSWVLLSQRPDLASRPSMHIHVCSIVSQLFVTPWTIAHQTHLSMEFSRQEYWSGMPFLPPDLPNPGIKPASPALVGGFFTTEPPLKPHRRRGCRIPKLLLILIEFGAKQDFTQTIWVLWFVYSFCSVD